MTVKAIDLLRNRHEWAPIDIEWHLHYVSEAKLAAGSSAEAINLSVLGEDHSVYITARGMGQMDGLQVVDTPWNRLVWVTILVRRETRSIRVTELSACSSTPGVEVAVLEHGDGVRLATAYFFDL